MHRCLCMATTLRKADQHGSGLQVRGFIGILSLVDSFHLMSCRRKYVKCRCCYTRLLRKPVQWQFWSQWPEGFLSWREAMLEVCPGCWTMARPGFLRM